MNTIPSSASSSSSSAVAEKARKFRALCIHEISRIGQNTVAELIGVSGPTVSRFVADDTGLDRACQVIAAAGLKVVPCNMRCYPEDYIGAIFTLAKINMNQIEKPQELSFE